MSRAVIYPGARRHSLYLMPYEYKAIKEWLYAQRHQNNVLTNLFLGSSLQEEDYKVLSNTLLTEEGELVTNKVLSNTL